MSEQLFYLQDSRVYVGNDVLWWAKDSKGYTTDLSKAHVFTKEAAERQHECRATDIPWPKSYIDGKTRPAVDFQYINLEEAMAFCGNAKPNKPGCWSMIEVRKPHFRTKLADYRDVT